VSKGRDRKGRIKKGYRLASSGRVVKAKAKSKRKSSSRRRRR
jgi:hypothetical protein